MRLDDALAATPKTFGNKHWASSPGSAVALVTMATGEKWATRTLAISCNTRLMGANSVVCLCLTSKAWLVVQFLPPLIGGWIYCATQGASCGIPIC